MTDNPSTPAGVANRLFDGLAVRLDAAGRDGPDAWLAVPPGGTATIRVDFDDRPDSWVEIRIPLEVLQGLHHLEVLRIMASSPGPTLIFADPR